MNEGGAIPVRNGIPNIRHLRVFREVARCRRISGAAEREHLSQPAATQAIAGLETRLDVALFDRRPDGLYTTPIGDIFLLRASRALEQLEIGAREATRIGLKARGRGFGSFDRLITAAQLRALIAVVEARNYSLAGRTLGISQPSVHRAARNLERLSGITLFESAHEGVSPTPAAQVLAQHFKLALVELQQGYEEIDEHLGIESAHIAVGTLPLARTFILPTAINAMVSSTGGVQIRAVDGLYAELLRSLRHGDLDCIIGALRNPSPADDVVQETLFDDPLAIVVGPGHPLIAHDAVTLAEVLRFPWVAPPKTTPAGSYLFDTLRIQDLADTPVRVVSSSLILIRGLLRMGDYITIISLHQIRHELAEGSMVPLPVELENNSRPIGLTYRRDWRPTPTQTKFMEQIRLASRSAAQHLSKNQ